VIRISEQPSQEARGRPDTAICCNSRTGQRSDECGQVSPLNARSSDARVFVAATVRLDVIIRDVLEVEHCLLTKAVFAFNDDCPKDVTEGLFRLLTNYNCMYGGLELSLP
jgi:hypothetical protein